MLQILFHLIGDYITQSQWMADNKTKSVNVAIIHAAIYTLPFWLIAPDGHARVAIFLSHLLIDRFRLARYVVWLKNLLGSAAFWKCTFAPMPRLQDFEDCSRLQWHNCEATGYPSQMPPYMTVWLLIAADNTLHLCCNYLAILFL